MAASDTPAGEVRGEVTSVSGTSGLVTTTSAQALTFEVSECRGFTPAAGQVVRIGVVDGMRARALSLIAEAPAPEYDPEAKYGLFQLTVLLRQPFDAAQLQQKLRGEGLEDVTVTSERVTLEAPTDNLVITTAGHSLLAQQVHQRFPADHLDTRNLDGPLDVGAAYLGLSGPPIPLHRLRPMLGPTLPDPWGPAGSVRTLHRVALRLVELGGTAVVANRGGEVVMPAELFTRLSGDLGDPACIPFGAWLDWALTRDGALFRCWGMLAFGLIDLGVAVKVDPKSPGFDAVVKRAKGTVLFAVNTALRRNREFDPGEVLEIPEDVAVGPYGVRESSGELRRFVIEDPGDEPYWLLRRE